MLGVVAKATSFVAKGVTAAIAHGETIRNTVFIVTMPLSIITHIRNCRNSKTMGEILKRKKDALTPRGLDKAYSEETLNALAK